MERLAAVAILLVIATVWNSIVAWLFIGFIWAIGALLGNTAFDPSLLLFWPLVLACGYLMLWEDARH